jgi:lysophospholipase L1-like esterase
MQFRTTLSIPQSSFELGYDTPLLMLGSCFTENIGARLQSLHLPVLTNPFGIVYNPISMTRNINYLMTNEIFSEKDIFQQGDMWHSWQHHSRFSSPEKAEILRGINDELTTARNHFVKTKTLILTLGTANVFVEKKSNQVVNNCHKSPPQYFEKKRLSVSDVVSNFKTIFEKILSQNTECQIVMTVSPIRHLRDGLIENNRSKAVLLLASAELSDLFPNVHYFPAYELVIDDLRDYRFFAPDMMHPTDQAIDYIWQHFTDTFFTEKTKIMTEEVHKINLMKQHRPLHPNTEGYQQFVNQLQQKVDNLKNKYPFLEHLL